MIVNEELETLKEEAVLASETLLAYFLSFEKNKRRLTGTSCCVSPTSESPLSLLGN
jgi:hypothetical protein